MTNGQRLERPGKKHLEEETIASCGCRLVDSGSLVTSEDVEHGRENGQNGRNAPAVAVSAESRALHTTTAEARRRTKAWGSGAERVSSGPAFVCREEYYAADTPPAARGAYPM